MTQTASRPRRLAGEGPLERRVRPQFAPDERTPHGWSHRVRLVLELPMLTARRTWQKRLCLPLKPRQHTGGPCTGQDRLAHERPLPRPVW
jgi:hypothetical protein